MQSRKTRFLIWFTALALVMACVPTLNSAPPVPPTLDANAINHIIMQTANAASTQTAAALPTSTSTPSPTFRPTNTETNEPSPTNTLIYIFTTPTIVVLPPLIKTFGPTSNQDYACDVLNSPENGTIYSPRLEFKVRWRLKNIGRKDWDGETVDFIYESGDRFHVVSGYDLVKTVKVGEVAELFVDMEAPKDTGNYTAHWVLRAGNVKFCRVSLTIGVR